MSSPDFQHAYAMSALRRRYVRLAAMTVAVVCAVRALDPAGGRWLRVARVVLGLGFLAAARSRAMSRGDGRVVHRVLTIVMVCFLVARGWAELPDHFPITFVLMPPLVLAATLLDDSPLLGVVVSAVCELALLTLLGLVALQPAASRPPFLVIHSLNTALSLLFNLGLGVSLRHQIRRGASELARSTAVLEEARAATLALSQALTERVTVRLRALRDALDAGPTKAANAAGDLADTLRECRAAVPPEPRLDDMELGRRLLELRHALVRWTLAAMVVALGAQLVIRVVAAMDAGRSMLPVALTATAWCTALALLISLIRRPRLWRPIAIGFHMIVFPLALVITWYWQQRMAVVPPSLVFLGIVATVAAVMLEVRVAVFELAAATAVVLVGGLRFGGPSLALAVNFVVAFGLVTWLVWRMPRDLVALLAASRQAAAKEIMRRRRLVATLFHDLASPLTVVNGTMALLAESPGDPDDEATVVDMVERMDRVVLAATGEESEALHAVKTGQLIESVERLFRARLLAKGMTLRVHGPREQLALCRETVVTESVLGNLMSNALKFSPRGAEVEFAVETEGPLVSLVVSDRGPGLPMDVKEAIRRGHTAASRPGSEGEGGNGYGLMLAREYVLEMGGELSFEDRPGGGLAARVRLRAA